MSTLCNCPPAATPPDIRILQCLQNFGQVAKVAGQRLRISTGAKNKFLAAEIGLLASWTAKLDSDTDDKIQVSPKTHGITNEAGDIIEFGGGDDTVGGIPIPVGSDRTEFNGTFIQQSSITISDLKQWGCEGDFGHWLINKDGLIGCLADDVENPTEYYPIPASGWSVKDLQFGNFTGVDNNAVKWYYAPNWSDKFVVVKPTDFNGLSDLLNG